MNLHANFKEHCKWAKKVVIWFWWESGLSSASRNRPTTFFRPFAHYAWIFFILSAIADQRKLRQYVGLENMNMTSYYDVTNNAHQIQMTPYATKWNPPWKFSVYATAKRQLTRDLYETKSRWNIEVCSLALLRSRRCATSITQCTKLGACAISWPSCPTAVTSGDCDKTWREK